MSILRGRKVFATEEEGSGARAPRSRRGRTGARRPRRDRPHDKDRI